VTLDFYFDVVCPYAYLASVRVEALARRCGAALRLRPVLLGGLLRTVGAPDDPNQGASAAKRRIQAEDRQRSAALHGVPLHEPPQHPRRTVDAMRLVLAAPDGPVRTALVHALMAAYWVRGDDVADRRVLAELAVAHGLPADAFAMPGVREGLREATAAAAAAGVFGVPSFGVDGRVWWGQDRMALVERALGGEPPPLQPLGRPAAAARVSFFHDFSSPFSYLAATQVERVAAAHGAVVEWVPILLGALFRELGTPDVPLHAMNAVKQAWVRRDLDEWAAWWGVPFVFPRRFPLRSVLPLRVALCEPAATRPIYRAAWAEDREVDTPAGLGEVLAAAGLPAAALLEQAGTASVKEALRANTERARAVGACGVPTFVVERAGRSALVWGQDRLALLEVMLAGAWPQDAA
jgi:2-hydroxychromene-2-carboxylate isomerase